MNVARNKNLKSLNDIGINPCGEMLLNFTSVCTLPARLVADYFGKSFKIGQLVVFCRKNKKLGYGTIKKIGRVMVTIGLPSGKLITRKFDNVIIV